VPICSVPQREPPLRNLNAPPLAPGPTGAPAPAQPAGRFGRTGWFNGRVALGILLVVLAVLGGALLLRRADATVTVMAAARDLPSGSPLTAADLKPVQVRLPSAQLSVYVRPGPAVEGSRLTAGVAKDALVPAAMLVQAGEQTDLVEYPVPVEPADVPDLRPGDRVAVAVSFDDGDKRGQGAILLPSVEVVRVLRGAASVGADDRIEAVQIRIPKDRLALVAGAIAGGRVSMARLAPGDLVGIQPVPATPKPAATKPAGGKG
jgi:hypothetical protein